MHGALRRALTWAAPLLLLTPATAVAQETAPGGDPCVVDPTSSTTSSTAPAEECPSTTTTSTTTTTTTAPPSTTTTTTPPGPPPEPQEVEAESPPEPPPTEPVEVPPAAEPLSIDLRRVNQLVSGKLKAAEATAALAETAFQAAQEKVASLEADVTVMTERKAQLAVEERRAIRRFERARELLRDRATTAFVRGPAKHLSIILESKNPNDFVRRMELVQSVLDTDQDAVDEFRAARRALTRDLLTLSIRLVETQDALEVARLDLLAAAEMKDNAHGQLSALEASRAIAVGGFVFPVGEPYSFVDTFGAPRMPGTEYEHLHQGTDIFAPSGTPLLACERAVVTRMGTDVLGGIKLWLVGASGNRYYYAHLSAYPEGLVEGQVVQAGDVVGYVGNTGNAVGTPSHLHFEIHAADGGVANPYPILKVLSDATRAARESGR